MWHKLFHKSKSSKNGNSSDDANCHQTPKTLNNGDNEHVATVRKSKNKLSNPFKRSRSSTSSDSSSSRQCNGSSKLSDIIGEVNVNYYSELATDYGTSTAAALRLLSKDSTNCSGGGGGDGSCGNNCRDGDKIAVNDRQLTTFTTFNSSNGSEGCRTKERSIREPGNNR